MSQYNISPEEIAKVISLYSRITNPEKRVYAQGYLNGLSATSSIISSDDTDCASQTQSDESIVHP